MNSVIVFLGGLAFAYILNGFFLRYIRNFGIASRQGQGLVRWASMSKPTIGGISFYITFLAGFALLSIIFPYHMMYTPTFLAFFLSMSFAFTIGLADDAFGMQPLHKFLGQILCAVILLSFGVKIRFFTLYSPDLWWLDYGLTTFWVVGLMNSLNMLDNMDGVTATVALSILITTLMMVANVEGLSIFFFLLIVIAGSLIAFLFFNWNPSRIYMGDTGSMFIGLLLAFVGIQYFWNLKTTPDNVSFLRNLLIPVMVFIVPLTDTILATFSRIFRGVRPTQGGKDHLTHHLVHVGVPEALIPLALGSVSLLSGTLTLVACKLIPEWDPLYSALFVIHPIALFSIFMYLYRKGGRIGKMKDSIANLQAAHKPTPVESGHIERFKQQV